MQAWTLRNCYLRVNHALEIVLFGLVFWLGLYLLSRDLKNLRLCLIGGGLTAYALSISCEVLSKYSIVASPVLWIAHLCLLLLSFFLTFPTGLLQFLLPGDAASSLSNQFLATQMEHCKVLCVYIVDVTTHPLFWHTRDKLYSGLLST